MFDESFKKFQKNRFTNFLSFAFNKLWYTKHPLRFILWPASYVYFAVITIRRYYLRRFCQLQFAVPIIVVGNLTVGGVGKTPLVIQIAKQLQKRGVRVGVVSRGYRSKTTKFPHEVSLDDKADLVGDEPLLIAKNTSCPVVIAPNRAKGVQYLLDKYQSEIIISDDGLQHYRMGRHLEIAVIDGVRYFGNGLLLPAGPLREDVARLKSCDFIVVNAGTYTGAYCMELRPGELTHLVSGKKEANFNFASSIAAVAAIGSPERFFTTLHDMGMVFNRYPFPDHHNFQVDELNFKESCVIMTEKDAVKCKSFAKDSWYYLPVEANLDDSFWHALMTHTKLQTHLK